MRREQPVVAANRMKKRVYKWGFISRGVSLAKCKKFFLQKRHNKYGGNEG